MIDYKFNNSWFGVELGYFQQVKISLSVIDENGRFYGKGTLFLCLRFEIYSAEIYGAKMAPVLKKTPYAEM